MRRPSNDWNGSSWSLMRLRPSKTSSRNDGTLSRNSNHEIGCFSQVHLSKTIWQNYGHCLTLSCLTCSIPMSSSTSGFLRTFKRTARIRKNSIKSRYSVCMRFSSHLCYGVSKRTWNTKSERSMSTRSYAKWQRGKKYCMSPSRRNWTWRSFSRCSNQRQRWRIWWTWSCNWGKCAIILSSLNVDQPAHLFPSNSCTTTQDPFLLEQER